MTGELPLLGFGLPVSGSWATPETMVHVARKAEELGYASLWTFQRVLDPGLGPEYRAVHDPVVPLAYVAARTTRIGLGTATICAPYTPPAVLAKSLSSLDLLSGGRLTVGLGIGWLEEEYAAAGVPFTRRGARMEDYLRCLDALWTQDPVEYAGEFYSVPRSHVAPRGAKPPVLLGGAAEPALRRAGREAQGWISSSRHDLTRIGDSIATVRQGAREAGRDPDAIRVLVRGLVRLGERGRPLQGTPDQIRDDLAELRARGVTEVFLDLNFDPRVGSPDADPGAALAYAEEVLAAMRPPPSA